MKLQKIILCVAVALTTFGVALGLLEIAAYVRSFFQPVKSEIQTVRPIPAPSVVYLPPSKVAEEPPAYTPPETSISEEETCELDEEGDFYIIGGTPKGFEDFDFLTVVTTHYDSKNDKLIAIEPTGWIQTTKKFKFASIKIKNKRLTIITQAKNGVSYRFEGKYVDEETEVKDEASGEVNMTPVSLKGRLTKLQNGKQIAEAKVKFFESCGC